MRIVATRPSAWVIPVVLAAVELNFGPEDCPFAGPTFDALACFGLNLAIGGALCASYEIGRDPPLQCQPVAHIPDAVTVSMWHPGCGRPLERETRIESPAPGHDGDG